MCVALVFFSTCFLCIVVVVSVVVDEYSFLDGVE